MMGGVIEGAELGSKHFFKNPGMFGVLTHVFLNPKGKKHQNKPFTDSEQNVFLKKHNVRLKKTTQKRVFDFDREGGKLWTYIFLRHGRYDKASKKILKQK